MIATSPAPSCSATTAPTAVRARRSPSPATLFPGAHAHVLHVWEPIERIVARYAVLAPFMGEELGEADAERRGRVRSQLAAAGAELAERRPDCRRPPHTAQLRTTVWEAVLDVAEELDVDVDHHRDALAARRCARRSRTRSRTRLIQHSPRPVLAIPSPAPPSAD